MQAGLDRRKFLVALTAVMGGAVSPFASKAILAAETFEPDGSLKILTSDQAQLLERIADVIIPETDTPGAAAAGVHFYIDKMVATWMGQKHAARFMSRLAAFEQAHLGFLEKSADQQIAVVQKLDDNMWQGAHADFYREMKELVLIGYYTSEVGASVELAYDPVPGPFHPVSIEDYDRTWST